VTVRRGFTLAETLTALVLFGVVASVLMNVLLGHQRLYRSQVQRVMVNESARAGLAVLLAELRQLSAAERDIIAADASSVTYESMQAFYVQCAPPDTGALAAVLDDGSFSGLRAIEAIDDSILLFAEGDPSTRQDDDWLVAAVRSVTRGAACPGGAASLTVGLDGISATQLAAVQAGAPARAFRPSRLLTYRDAGGAWWLGSREFHESSGTWTTTQPIVGPLSATGLTLTFVDDAGIPTAVLERVVAIRITIEGQSLKRVPRSGGNAPISVSEDLMTQMTLRNNPWY
jgi:prepilin-type N-terminal cleavage/methylation domain-containing protein